jgi:hypothetical protein
MKSEYSSNAKQGNTVWWRCITGGDCRAGVTSDVVVHDPSLDWLPSHHI